jgi:hypothetical protein
VQAFGSAGAVLCSGSRQLDCTAGCVTMARRVFFSFHYDRDVQRAQVVRQSWVTKPDRETAGFFDSSVFEATKRTGDAPLKRFLDDGLSGSSVACVLYGAETVWRRWVRYELLRSFLEGKGIFGVAVAGIAGWDQRADIQGPNPLAYLGYEVSQNALRLKELTSGGQWIWSSDFAAVPVARVPWGVAEGDNRTFNQFFQAYDWINNDGYSNLGTWAEAAAKVAGR